MRVTLPPLHEAQQQIAEDNTRFKVVAAGRRFGKTKLAALLCVQTALTGGKAWWVAPSFPLANIGWREIKRLCKQIPGAYPRLADRIYYLPGGGFVQARSALTEAGLRGEGLDFCVVDECAFMPEARWHEELRPALSDRQGGAMFISTPMGKNWFWRLWMQGQDESQASWSSYSFPSTANPFFPASELEEARRNLPERVFRQEYMAEFMDDAGLVFRDVNEAAVAERLDRGVEGRTYVAGIDWGRQLDATVISVVDIESGDQVYLDRFTGIGWDAQIGRVWGVNERFEPNAWIVEKNTFGGPQVERLQADGLPIVPWVASNATKQVVIQALMLAFETGQIRILPDRTQMEELKAYTFTTTKSGLTRYHAPEGMHDDTVIALALAWHGRMGAAVRAASTFGLHQTSGAVRRNRPGPLAVLTGQGTGSKFGRTRPRRVGERFGGQPRSTMPGTRFRRN